MKADIRWLDDASVFRVGEMAAHSDHAFYADAAEADAGASSLRASLDGEWDFKWSVNSASRPADFYKEDADLAGFTKITVPGHMEISGFDRIHYINTMYPWEGKYYRRPADVLAEHPEGVGTFADADYNPVGSYRLTFDLPEQMAAIGRRARAAARPGSVTASSESISNILGNSSTRRLRSFINNHSVASRLPV